MRAVSQEALERAASRWLALLHDVPGHEITWGGQAFDVADVLRSQPRLARALTEVSRSADDRAALAASVLTGRASGEVADLLTGLARDQWANPADLADAVEHLGVLTILSGAQRNGLLSGVEEEMYRAMRLLAEQRNLRLALGDSARPASKRADLARRLWAGKVNEASLALIARAVERSPRPTIASALSSYVDVAASLASRLVASVTVATPMTAEQEERLTRILAARYGMDVSLHVAIDPATIGGMRIHIGDDVIDATLATRIKGVKDAIKK